MLPEGFSDCQLLFLLLQNRTKEPWREKLAFVMLARAEQNSKPLSVEQPMGKNRSGSTEPEIDSATSPPSGSTQRPSAGVSPGDPALAESDGKADWRIHPRRSRTRALVVDFRHAAWLRSQRGIHCRLLPDSWCQRLCEFQDQPGAGTRAGRFFRRADGLLTNSRRVHCMRVSFSFMPSH